MSDWDNADGLSRQSWEEAGKCECHIPTSVSEEKEGDVTGLVSVSSYGHECVRLG